MKIRKIVFAVIIAVGFTFSCTPQAIDDENPTEILGTGGDDSTTVDDTRD